MFPERIQVGANTVIGYNTTILAHEYLIEEYRLGDVLIGDRVMIGANSTILPGIKIGDGAIVSAATLVHKDVPAGAFVGGNPMKIIQIVLNFFIMKFIKTDGIKSPVYCSGIKLPAELPQLIKTLR